MKSVLVMLKGDALNYYSTVKGNTDFEERINMMKKWYRSDKKGYITQNMADDDILAGHESLTCRIRSRSF